MVYTLGIDVSTHQDSSATAQRIDWSKPALHGVKFVINRVSYSAPSIYTANRDDDFDYNWEHQKGVYLRGAYGFFGYWPGAPAVANQVRVVVDALKSDPGEMPVFWADVEKANSYYPEINRSATLPQLEAYMKGIEDGLGLELGIYTNLAGIAALATIPKWLLEKPLWLAWPLSPTTGETVEAYIERVKPVAPLKQWGKWLIWQYSWKGDGKALGMESYGLDMNYFAGSEDELRAWCKQTTKPEQPEEEQEEEEEEEDTMTDWTKNAIGLYTKTADWTNTGFDFIVGYAGGGYEEPNPELKPIEIKATAEGKPFGALWDFKAAYYSRNQILGDDAHWPAKSDDYPFQMFVRALTSRDPKLIIVQVMTYLDDFGKTEDPGYLAYAAQKFITRAAEWVNANKPKAKFVVCTNHEFLTKYAPAMAQSARAAQYNSMVYQKATLPLANNAFPQSMDKVKFFISTRETCEMWYFYDSTSLDMMLYRMGDRAALYQWLGFDGTVEEPEEEPEVETGVVVVDELRVRKTPANGAVQAMLYEGMPVTIKNKQVVDGNEWYEVTVSGWVAGTFKGNQYIKE